MKELIDGSVNNKHSLLTAGEKPAGESNDWSGDNTDEELDSMCFEDPSNEFDSDDNENSDPNDQSSKLSIGTF